MGARSAVLFMPSDRRPPLAGGGSTQHGSKPMSAAAAARGATTALPDPATHAAVAAYAAACRARIPAFAARHFGLAGTLRLHQEALGLDLLRAPLNVLLVGPALFLRLATAVLSRLGLVAVAGWLAGRQLFLETRLAQRVADLILKEILALDEAAPWQERARHLIAEYLAARHAVAEFATGIAALLLGLGLVHALTPSALSLGPMLAREMAQQEAIQGFWLGSWVGSLYYGWFPVDAGWARTVLTTVVAMVGFALVATFMGLITDPLQQLLGVHQWRLRRLVDALERAALGESGVGLALPDPWIPRVADLADMALMATRLTR
jgi:uncharacterized protein DUF6635